MSRLDCESEESAGHGQKSGEPRPDRNAQRIDNRVAVLPAASGPRICVTRYHIQGWALGTGLRVSLQPGRYEITGEETLQGIRFFRLNNKYRVAARDVEQAEDPTRTVGR